MDSQKTKIQELLRHNLFLSEEKKGKILAKLEAEMDTVSVENLYQLLQKAGRVQTELLQKAIKKNPDFLKEIQRTISGQKKIQIREDEAVDRAGEANELSELEAEFDTIFS